MSDITATLTVRNLWESAVRFAGKRPFLVFEGNAGSPVCYSYRAFDEEINRAANLFAAAGVLRGDRVTLQLCNSPEFLLALFGLAKIGAVAVPLSTQSPQRELEQTLETCEARFAVIEGSALETYRAAAAQARGACLTGGIFAVRLAEGCAEGAGGAAQPASAGHTGGAAQPASAGHTGGAAQPASAVHAARAPRDTQPAPLYNFDALRALQEPELINPPALRPDDLAEILFTSGTTSQPKGVMITHANLVFSGIYGVWQVSLQASDRLLTTMPACHSNFQMSALMPVLVAGACLVLVERYSARRFWQQIRKHRATITQMISMMVRTQLLQPERANDAEHSLREVLYFMPLANEEKDAFEQRFGARLMNTYGSTESIGWVLTDPPYGERRWPSVGRVGLGYEVGVFDEQGQELPVGEVGELRVKGQRGVSVMLGYYRDPEATKRVFGTDGWMGTGDKGYQGEDGWFYFVDRQMNMIKRAGENISATEIENVLTAHPLIAEAAAIGVADEIRDEIVKVFVLPVPGAELTVEDVREWCRGRLARYKLPSLIEMVADFPRTASMKIEKRLLR